MVRASFQPLRTDEPEEDDDCEPGDWDGAEDDILTERLQPSTFRGSTRQVRPQSMAGRLSLGFLRQGKVAGTVSVLLALGLAVGLLVEAHARHREEGLRAARARTQDTVEKDGMMQTQGQVQTQAVSVNPPSAQYTKTGAAVAQQQVTQTQGCRCCCMDCGCEEGSVAYCSSLICPTGYIPRDGGEHIECRGDTCTLEADLAMCCNRRATCEGYMCQPGWSLKAGAANILCSRGSCGAEDNTVCCEQKSTCVGFECPAGSKIRNSTETIVCSGGGCIAQDCCEEIPGMTIQSTTPGYTIITPTKSSEIDSSTEEERMLCDLNCFNEGVDSVTVELPEEDTKTLETCREACKQKEECHAIVYRKDFEQTGESICHGKKEVHIALCQPGGEFITEIIRDRPWGKCALLGDPHVVQWDRPSQFGLPTYDNYDAGDYILLESKELDIHARFGFTERFPTATSTKGIAVRGSKIQDKVLVAGYSESKKQFIAWWDGTVILEEKGDSVDDGVLVAKYEDLDPTEFHSEARHTIGEEAQKLPSWTFQFKDVPLKIYMLMGPDSVNAVLEMQKLDYPMDGLCGNFNCDPNDEDSMALEARSENHALDWKVSTFGQADGTFHEKTYAKGTGMGEDVLAKCDPDLLEQGRKACGFHDGVDDAEANNCLADVCLAGSADVAEMEVATVEVEQQVDEDVEKH